MTTGYVEITAEMRNKADAEEIQRIRDSGKPMELTTPHLLYKLRYMVPGEPTIVESILIPAMQRAFPELAADFTSYQNTPTGCGCASKITTTLSRETFKTQSVLDQVFGEGLYTHVKVTSDPQAIGAGHSLIGHAALIDATPDAWAICFTELQHSHGRGSKHLLQQQYKGVVVKDVENGAKWLLLFY